MVKLSIFLNLALALCWGRAGHQTCGLLTEKLLFNTTINYLKELFKQEYSMANLSTWADEIKNHRIYGHQWSWSKRLHYISVPQNATPETYEAVCQNNRCSIGGVYNFTKNILSDNTSIEIKKDSIKFLIHIIQDISQPLHNYGHKRGGNLINFTFNNRSRSLLLE